ncbi:MAG TPA: BON domain-containing protein [Roseiarcus sp.]|nr:BON domain-containing protein [Roseiarcus sp.]
MDDKALRQNVVSELDFDPSIDAETIGVAVEGGVVTLTGHVGSYAEKIAAERAAQRVKGVRAIAQEIVVRYPEDKKTADDQIAERAVSIMSWDARIPAENVMVKVQQGWVTLSGEVSWHFQREAAESSVRRLSGVVGVTNEIRVTPSARPEDVRSRIIDALERNAELEADSINVLVHGDKVTLEGKVKAWYEREVAERAAWSVPGVAAVEDHLTLA